MIQIAFDSADPHALAAFWADVVDYEIEDHSELVQSLVAAGQLSDADVVERDGRSAFADVAAASDPAGRGPRLYFQRVPEEKVAKNRVHIDVSVQEERREAESQRLVTRGATLLWITSDRGPTTYTMQDPEGNEFCLH